MVGSVHLAFFSQILANVCLTEDDDFRRVDDAALGGGTSSDAKADGEVVEGEDDHALVLRGVLGDPGEAGLEDVVAVEEAELLRGLDPDLVLGVRSHEVQEGDLDVELLRVRELAHAGAQTHHRLAIDHVGHRKDLLAHIIHSVLLQPEAIGLIRSFNQMANILPNTFKKENEENEKDEKEEDKETEEKEEKEEKAPREKKRRYFPIVKRTICSTW